MTRRHKKSALSTHHDDVTLSPRLGAAGKRAKVSVKHNEKEIVKSKQENKDLLLSWPALAVGMFLSAHQPANKLLTLEAPL